MSSLFEQQLEEMGFTKDQIQKALAATGNSSVQAAMEWIFSHPMETTPTETTPAQPLGGGEQSLAGGEGGTETSMDTTAPSEPQPVVHNALCDQCKQQIVGIRYKCKNCKDYDLCPTCYEMRLVYHDPDHEFGAHTEEIPMPERRPLTEEEKQAALEKLKQRRLEMLAKQKEEEEKAARERELKRRAQGKEIQEAQRAWKEAQMKREAEARKKEKQDDILARKAIREKIAKEKAARLAAKGKTTGTASTPTPTPTPTATAATGAASTTATECTIQVRLSDGKTIQNKFKPTDSLRVVYNWVSHNRSDGAGPFALSTTYPRKDYSGSALDSTTLKDAELVPRGALLLKKF
jgi:hypothetical protein